MIVFKTFLKILNRCKAPVIMYTAFLVFFGGFNMQSDNKVTEFASAKPDVVIINEDGENVLTHHMVAYLEDNYTIKDLDMKDEAFSDALFYRQVNYIIKIPKNFANDFENGKETPIEVNSTGDYQASLAEIVLSRYLEVADTYRRIGLKGTDLASNIDATLQNDVDVELTSKLDSSALDRATFYFNFMNYCILAGTIYVITLILSEFKKEAIAKRTIISSMDYGKHNRYLFLSNGLFAVSLLAIYIVLGLVLVGDILISWHGLLYVVNAFIFTLCARAIATLIGTISRNKEAINGIVNVVALGSSFLAGAFVPMEWLPKSVLNIAQVLPSYWFIKTNEAIKTIEEVNFRSIEPLLLNMGILLGFTILFAILGNIVAKRKRKFA